MSRLLNVALVMMTTAAFAKPWNGIEPGIASVIDVIGKFGEPSKRKQMSGKDVLVYSGDKAMQGTVQVQFKVNPATQTIDRIDLYPAPVITAQAIEKSYGTSCQVQEPSEPCYYKRETATKHAYFLYLKLGLAIFFKDDGVTVRSFSFLPTGCSVPTASASIAP